MEQPKTEFIDLLNDNGKKQIENFANSYLDKMMKEIDEKCGNDKQKREDAMMAKLKQIQTRSRFLDKLMKETYF